MYIYIYIYLGSTFPGPGLETWLPPDSCRRQKRFFTCASFRVLFEWVPRLPGEGPADIFRGFRVRLRGPGTAKTMDSVQYIL